MASKSKLSPACPVVRDVTRRTAAAPTGNGMATTSRSVQHYQPDGLPKAFVESLRVLFDILDEDKDGLVPLAEIKERWQSDGLSGLPVNVVESLRKVAPKNGKLSFERFCCGLKLALCKGRTTAERGSSSNGDKYQRPTTATVRPSVVHPMRTKSAPQLPNAPDKRPRSVSENGIEKPNNVLKPNNMQLTNKPTRKPHRHSTGTYDRHYTHDGDRSLNYEHLVNKNVQSKQIRQSKGAGTLDEIGSTVPTRKDVPPNPYRQNDYMNYADLYHSPISVEERPNRTVAKSSSSRPLPISSRPLSPTRSRPLSQSRALSPLLRPLSPTRPISPTRSVSPTPKSKSPTPQQIEKEQRRQSGMREQKSIHQVQYNGSDALNRNTKESARGKTPDRKQVNNTNQNGNHDFGGLQLSDPAPVKASKKSRRSRDEPRRHTLSNGVEVDYNLLKRMKQLEHEHDVLLQGLEAADRAREWYKKQLATIKEKQRYIHKGQFGSGEDTNSQSYQDHVAFQKLRIVEVNRQLAALMDNSDRGFPDHINLAMQGRHSIYLPVDTPISAQLREQNRLLTKEVTQKSDCITQLEQEKTTLIRQLFDVKSKTQHERESVDIALFL